VSIWDRLKNYRSRGPEASPPIELLPLREFESKLSAELDRQLAPHGFVETGKRRWGKEWAPEINAMIELEPLKGAFTAAWGVSLPFVPHLTTDLRVAWHKTLKAARLDLSYHPRDYTESRTDWVVSQLATREELATEAPAFASDVAENALAFLAPLRSMEALRSAFESKRDRPFVQFGFANYPQELLAFAFVLARCGRRTEADSQIQAFWTRVREFDDGANVREETVTVINKLLSGEVPG
jgi:hypothetical protein